MRRKRARTRRLARHAVCSFEVNASSSSSCYASRSHMLHYLQALACSKVQSGLASRRATQCFDPFCSAAMSEYWCCTLLMPQILLAFRICQKFLFPYFRTIRELCAVEASRVICSPWPNLAHRHANGAEMLLSPAAERQTVYRAFCKHAKSKRQSWDKRLLVWKLCLQRKGSLKWIVT